MPQFDKRAHRARDTLDALKRDWPAAFDAVERLRAGRPPDQPDWCFLPMTAWMTGASQMLGRAHPDRAALATQLAALTAWRMTQGIYRIDPDVYAAVVDTPLNGDVPADALLRMPEWCVYIETPGMTWLAGEPVYGFWAHLDRESDGTPVVYFLQDSEEDGRPYLRSLFVELRGSIEDDLTRSLSRLEESRQGDVREHFGDIASAHRRMISLLLYLCVGPDIAGKHGAPGNPTPTRTRRHGWRMYPADGPRVWDVGLRMGAALRQAYNESESSDGRRSGPRPHVRVAHWHTFVSGARKRPDGTDIPAAERRREVRWMPPIPVNVSDVGTLPSVIRRVG